MERHLSEHAAAAKAIREELKRDFPHTKFSVKSSSYSGGSAVYINYNGDVPWKIVNSCVAKYQYGHWDGMVEIYNYTNTRPDIPQVKYVIVQKEN